MIDKKITIGAGDIPAIMGVSPWKKPVDVWLEKLGYVEPDLPSEAMQIGTKLEPKIIEMYEEEKGVKCTTAQYPDNVYHHPIDDWAVAQIDAKVTNDHNKTVEIKYATLTGAWLTGIPQYVQMQCQWQMYVVGTKCVDVAVLFTRAYPNSQRRFNVFVLQRDEEQIKTIYEVAKKFYNENLLANIMPADNLTGEGIQKYIREQYPADKKPEYIQATAEDEELIEKLIMYKEKVQQMQMQIENIESKLKLRIKDHVGMHAEKLNATIMWKTQERKNVDNKKIYDDYKVELSKYTTKTTLRPFRLFYSEV